MGKGIEKEKKMKKLKSPKGVWMEKWDLGKRGDNGEIKQKKEWGK